MARSHSRIAVVVVHGMGNQYPMETLRSFCEGLKPPDAHLYSSPNRITDDDEVRRLSFSNTPFDYFEYYWAHHMEEPGLGEVLKWSFQLLFWKKPSNSMHKHINLVRFSLIFLILGIGVLAAGGYLVFKDQINSFLKATFLGLSVLVVVRIIWSLITSTVIGLIQSSIGDVIKYTIPSPKNISVRDKIRRNGVDLVKKLHDAKKADGRPKYSKIIIVGHSLGSIVAYDILTSLFADYHTDYKKVPAVIDQSQLEKVFQSYSAPDHTNGAYQNKQGLLFNEYQQLGNQWRVSHFITMGSPLTHASMILSKGEVDFSRRKEQREFPTSPPQLDHEDKHFTFGSTFNSIAFTPVTIRILHHAALFAMTQWTNVYYKNDWIGGPLAPEFGKGINDREMEASSSKLRLIPMSTHTLYWDTKEVKGLTILKELLEAERTGPRNDENG